MGNKINWLAIIASAVVGMGLGFLFYGALFQDIWMAGNGLTQGATEMEMLRYGEKVDVSSLPMIINTVAMFIYALIMNWLIGKTNMTSWSGGATLGAAVGFIVFLDTYVGNRFAANPTSLSMVDGGYAFLLFIAMGAIIGGWRKS